MTDDHLNMLVCQKDQFTRHYVWDDSLGKFTHLNTIVSDETDSGFVRKVWIEDTDFILVPDRDLGIVELKPFQWNSSSNRF